MIFPLRAVAVLFVFNFAGVTSFGQTPVRFDVASIGTLVRLNGPDAPRLGIQNTASRLTANTNVRNLIAYAYNLKDYQISEGPAWTRSSYFTIAASIQDGKERNTPEMRLLTRTLLAERFGLSVQKQSKEMSVYRMTVSTGGAKLKTTPTDGTFSLGVSRGQMKATKITMERFAQALSGSLDRPVTDHTNLTAEYDLILEGSEIDFMPMTSRMAPPEGTASIFSEMPSRLGLKLDAVKEAVEILTIVQVSLPTEN